MVVETQEVHEVHLAQQETLMVVVVVLTEEVEVALALEMEDSILKQERVEVVQ
jgi:hypothetical protein